MRIFILILSIIIGTLIIKYSFWFGITFGHMQWAEEKLGAASTYTVWKLIGIVVIVLGVIYGFRIFG